MWRYLRDVFIVLGILLILSGVFVGWTIFAVCALACTYFASFFMGRGDGKK